MENQFGAASTCSCDAEALYFKHFHVDISIIKMLCVRMLFCNWSFCFFNVKQRRFNALLFPNLLFNLRFESPKRLRFWRRFECRGVRPQVELTEQRCGGFYLLGQNTQGLHRVCANSLHNEVGSCRSLDANPSPTALKWLCGLNKMRWVTGCNLSWWNMQI